MSDIHGNHENDSQKRDDRWKTFWHERYKNGDSERDRPRGIPFVHSADTDGEEHDGKRDGDEGDY